MKSGVWNWLTTHLTAEGIPEPTALKILSLGFALGLLIGRVVVSRILVNVPAATVTLVSSVLMAITTYAMIQSGGSVTAAAALVFWAESRWPLCFRPRLQWLETFSRA